MARYNSVTAIATVSGATPTISAPQTGLLTTFNASITGNVSLPNPVLYPGSTQSFYNISGAAVTVSAGTANIKGPGLTAATTQSIPNNAFYSVTSDGTDYVLVANDGGPQIGTTGTLTGGLALNTSGALTTDQTTGTLFNTTATTVNIAGAATTIAIGASSGTLTIGNATITATNATALNLNGTNPGIVTSSTGTASVFNTNALTGNLFGAATTISIGASTGTSTINNDLNLASGKVLKINSTQVLSSSALGSGVTGSSLTSVGTLTSLTVSGAVNAQANVTLGASSSNTITANGYFNTSILPSTNTTYNLGSASYRWSTVYTGDLDLSNGIGDYTIVEGEDDLFLYNNKKGKVYKFAIIEVDPSTAPAKK